MFSSAERGGGGGGGGGGGTTNSKAEGINGRIFLVMKFFIPGFFCWGEEEGNFASIFFVCLDLSTQVN